jgi:hypothetical protein
MTIVGVDPSVSKTGVVIRREGGAYSSFLAVPPSKSQDPARLYWIASTVVADCRLDPEAAVLLVIEHPTPRRQLDQNYPLFWRLREEFAWYYDTQALVVWPAQLNKFATGTGKVSEIGGAVVRQWGECLPSEYHPDVLDALALCKFGEAFLGLCEVSEKQMDVVSRTGVGKKAALRAAELDGRTFAICRSEESA